MTAAAPTTSVQPVFRGIGVALVSLFDRGGTLLVDDTAALAKQLVDDGVAAVLIGGTTGEFWTLDNHERVAVTQAVRAAVPAHIPVLLNVGAPSPAATLAAAATVPEAGPDAVLCLTPPAADPAQLYPAVRERIDGRPLLAYHFPRAGFAPVPLEAIADLVDGTKDSSGDAERLAATPPLPAGVFTGSPLLLTLAGAMGLAGAMLALANVEPATAAAALGGDGDAQARMVELHRDIVRNPPPRGVKQLTAQRYGTPAFTRSPTLREALDAAG